MGDLISTNHYKCQNTQPAKAEEISALVEFSLKDEFSSQILELLAKSVFLFLFAEHIENRLALATYTPGVSTWFSLVSVYTWGWVGVFMCG